MSAVEVLEQHGIQNIVPDHPGMLLLSITLPVDQAFKPATPPLRVQVVLDLVVGLGFLEEEARRVPFGSDKEGEKGLRSDT